MIQLNPSQNAMSPTRPPAGKHIVAESIGNAGLLPAAASGLLLFGSLLAIGCTPSAPVEPPLVYPSDLVRSYAREPSVAARAYTGQVICMPLHGFRRDGIRLTWALGEKPESIPILILRFNERTPDPNPDVWIEGHVDGCDMDNLRRELPGYDFTIRLTACRIVPRPARLP